MSWYVVEAVVRYLLGTHSKKSKMKTEKLIVGFKASIIEKYLEEKKKFSDANPDRPP